MKKALLATSALVMMAGAASAEIALSGSARMGVVYLDGNAFFSSRVRIVFTASGETDTGLSFGASVRADQSGGNGGLVEDDNGDLHLNGTTGTLNGDSTVFISGAFGKLTMGDVSGAADALVGQVSGVGYGPIDGLHEIDHLGTVKTAVYYEYTGGQFTFGLGAGQMDTEIESYNIGVKYATDTYSVALAWERADDGVNTLTVVSLGGSVSFDAVTVTGRVSDVDTDADTAYALSVDYTTGATTITGFYTDYGDDPGFFNGAYSAGSTDTQHFGLGVSYDLGGGATLAGSVVQQNNTGVADATFADIGLKFSF